LRTSRKLIKNGFQQHEEEVSPFGEGSDAKFLAIDMACRERMVAIEFDGPSHYNSDGKSNSKRR
jgi:hypothetical protein